MNVTEYLAANADALEDPYHPSRSAGFHGLYVDKADQPFFAVIRKSVCAHVWLLGALNRSMEPGDARREVLSWANDHAETCVRVLAYQLKESDPFLLQPGHLEFGRVEPSRADPWIRLGLSALALELVLEKAGKIGEPQFAQFHWPLQAMGAGFGRERRFALAEAGRLAASKSDPETLRAIRSFTLPAEDAWGAPFIPEVFAALEGHITSRKDLLRSAIAAIREAPGIPHDPWIYLEPQLDRHAKTFGIGAMKKLAVRAALKLF